MAFYSTHGFRVDKIIYGYYTINKKKENAYLLVRELDEKFFKKQKSFIFDCCEGVINQLFGCIEYTLKICCGFLFSDSQV